MSSTAFGTPVQDQPVVEQQAATNGTGENAQVQELDPNDPRLTSEILDDNAEADAYATLPPLPDGKYRAKLKQVDVRGADGKPVKDKPNVVRKGPAAGTPYLQTAVEAEVLGVGGQEQYDGYKVTDYWVPTQPNRNGTSPAATIIRAAGGQTPQKYTHRQLMDLLHKTLAGEPEVVVETAWEWQCANEHCEASRNGLTVKGEHRFKQAPGGKGHDPQLQCEKCKGFTVARPRIVGYTKVK